MNWKWQHLELILQINTGVCAETDRVMLDHWCTQASGEMMQEEVPLPVMFQELPSCVEWLTSPLNGSGLSFAILSRLAVYLLVSDFFSLLISVRPHSMQVCFSP